MYCDVHDKNMSMIYLLVLEIYINFIWCVLAINMSAVTTMICQIQIRGLSNARFIAFKLENTVCFLGQFMMFKGKLYYF